MIWLLLIVLHTGDVVTDSSVSISRTKLECEEQKTTVQRDYPKAFVTCIPVKR